MSTPDLSTPDLSTLDMSAPDAGADMPAEDMPTDQGTPNRPPVLDSLPALSAHWGQEGGGVLGPIDPDGDALTYKIVSTTCSFDVAVDARGLISFTCGAQVEVCEAQVWYSDGEFESEVGVPIACTNTPPTVADVAISPAAPTSAQATLTCGYTFADADGDADASLVEWLNASDEVIAEGASLPSPPPASEVRCRVTPRDGAEAGEAVVSAAVTTPSDVRVGAGAEHACALKDGALYCWGNNRRGQLGMQTNAGFNATNASPFRVFASGVTALALGDEHTCAVHQGALKCWGLNERGQLGMQTNVGTVSPNPTPHTVIASGVVDVTTARNHTCALLRTGAVQCWGINRFGELGSPASHYTFNPILAPYEVLDAGVTAVAAGYYHTCAVQSGALKCWGAHEQGQLGSTPANGDLAPNVIANAQPVTVFAAGVTALGLGANHTCAVSQDTLQCWGSHAYGQLGAAGGSVAIDAAPTPAQTLGANVTAVDGDAYHTCAIQLGSLKCWGANHVGQTGGLLSPNLAPTPSYTVFTSDATSVATGRLHTCAVHQGEVKCWGLNSYGVLGTSLDEGASVRTPRTIRLP